MGSDTIAGFVEVKGELKYAVIVDGATNDLSVVTLESTYTTRYSNSLIRTVSQ